MYSALEITQKLKIMSSIKKIFNFRNSNFFNRKFQTETQESLTYNKSKLNFRNKLKSYDHFGIFFQTNYILYLILLNYKNKHFSYKPR